MIIFRRQPAIQPLPQTEILQSISAHPTEKMLKHLVLNGSKELRYLGAENHLCTYIFAFCCSFIEKILQNTREMCRNLTPKF